MDNITKPSITRLARRAGVKSISDDCFDVVRDVIKEKLDNIVSTALVVNAQHQTKTMMPEHIYETLHILGYNISQSTDLGTSACSIK